MGQPLLASAPFPTSPVMLLNARLQTPLRGKREPKPRRSIPLGTWGLELVVGEVDGLLIVADCKRLVLPASLR